MQLHRFAFVLFAAIAWPAAAQKMAPGLWEVSMQMPAGAGLGAAMGQMNEQLAKMSPECSGDPPSSGEGEYVFSGDKGYQGKMMINTVRAGKPASMEMQLTGRFIAADCGDVKPRQ